MSHYRASRRAPMLCGAALLFAACSAPAPTSAVPAPVPTATSSDALPTTVPTTVATAGIAPAITSAPPTLAPAPATSETATPVPEPPAAATPAPSAPAPATPVSATPVPATATAALQVVPAAANAVRFQVVPNQSKAIFRVREQLARLQSPSDAVGSTGKVSGQIVVNPDGTIAAGQSQVTVDVSDLRTDDQLRDGVIKRTTLQTQRFPTAQFVAMQALGLPNPLPASGEYAFQLTGKMTLHGVDKVVTWDVTAKRAGNSLTGTATTKILFEDFGMERPQAAVVLSVVDEIRLELQLVANQV